LDYTKFIPIIVKSLQELNKRIEKLERLERLERLEKLKNKEIDLEEIDLTENLIM